MFKPTTATAETPESASVLRPSAAAGAKLSETQRQRAEDAARVGALRTMNAVRMLAPVLATVAAEGGSDEDQAHRFATAMGQAHALAVDACLVLGLDPARENDRWSVNVFERTFAQALSGNMAQPPGREVVRALVEAARKGATDMPPYQDVAEDVSLSMARIQAMGPVLRAQAIFDFARPRDTTIAEVMACLDQEVSAALDFLVDPLAGASERRTLFSVLSQEAGTLMAEAWQHEATRALAALRKKSQAERDAWKLANPQGLPIETVIARFKQHMSRLTKLTKQLRPATTKPTR